MFDHLETYLELYATPEQSAMIMSACTALTDAGFTDHAAVISQEIEIADNLDDDFLVGLVNGYLLPLYRMQLQAFGIGLSVDADLVHATAVFQAVMLLDNWADNDALLDAVSADLEPAEALADLLAVTGGFQSEYYLNVLDTVSPDLIERITQLAEETAANSAEPASLVVGLTETLQRCRQVMALLRPDQYSLLTAYLNEGGKLGLAPRMLNLFYQDLIAITDPLKAAYEILALAATTQIETIHLAHLTMHLLEQLDFDDLRVGGCRKAVDELVAQLTN